jgi:glutamyl-Q tRNA(Asp) synthetase
MIVTRFAPSPTGLLHSGHAYAALHAAEPVRVGGRLLLRIEDIDQTRCRPLYTDAILEDLAWLGLHWHGPVRTQAAHLEEYAACLHNLRERDLLYPCFCTRAEITAITVAPHDPNDAPLYPGTCRNLDPALRRDRLAQGDPHAWRLDTARALRACAAPLAYRLATGETVSCHPGRFGDVVLARKDIPASYHLCVTHDDAIQGITLVTRGEDLREVTDIHRLLQSLLGWPTPAYRFHPLLISPDGRRLAKRDGATSLRSMREAGMTATELRHRLGFGQ